MAKRASRKDRALQTKQALFQKGQELLKNVSDPNDFVVEEITESCGVSKATFYLYFKSKEDFYYRVKMSYARSVRDLYVSCLSARGPVRTRVLSFARAWVEAVRLSDLETSRDWLTLFADKSLRAVVHDEHMDVYSYLKPLEIIVQHGIEKGEFMPETPCDAVAKQIMVVLSGVHAISVMTDKELDFEECTQYAVDLVDKGVLQPWLAVSRGDVEPDPTPTA